LLPLALVDGLNMKNTITTTKPVGQVCTGCKQLKPWQEFYKNNRAKTGFKSRCKTCCAPRTYIIKDLTADQEALINRKAIEKLIKNHPKEYLDLLMQEKVKIK
jgi:hypothetical protein